MARKTGQIIRRGSRFRVAADADAVRPRLGAKPLGDGTTR
jgi:hypothetical protein